MSYSTVLFTANGTFNWPYGVAQVTVECWGGGAGGGGATGSPAGGGGGGGGTYAKRVLTRPSNSQDTVTVGAQVTGTTAAGTNGNVSWFRSNDANGCVAQGGIGGGLASGTSQSAGGGGSSTASNVGDISRSGGTGGTGSAGASGGGGGSGSGADVAGNNGGVTTGGVATEIGGVGRGAGGAGGDAGTTGGTGGVGATGTAPGGGGGGGRAGSGTDRAAGNGARGEVRVSYQNPDIESYKSIYTNDANMRVTDRIR